MAGLLRLLSKPEVLAAVAIVATELADALRRPRRRFW